MWLSYLLGMGFALSRDGEADVDWHPAVDAAIVAHDEDSAFRIGLHARYARAHDWTFYQPTTSAVIDWEADLHTLDLAAEVDMVSAPWTFQPWLGVHLARGTETIIRTEMDPQLPQPKNSTQPIHPEPRFVAGALLSLDLYAHDRHHVAVYVELEMTDTGDRGTLTDPRLGARYAAATFGLAYRR